ncbi:hypothetical protein F0562_019531 [Nyssa sinensis]|uniref:Uncharacterized protein n=1 Tax=Nyssa sinensis TaxID=561372 RepID=A0A5J5BP20_9ASTE|nr:hypothetical protein F0562_019531 [Nyssa sinensis]
MVEGTIVDGVTSEVIDRTVVEIIGREDHDFVRSRGWDLCGRMGVWGHLVGVLKIGCWAYSWEMLCVVVQDMLVSSMLRFERDGNSVMGFDGTVRKGAAIAAPTAAIMETANEFNDANSGGDGSLNFKQRSYCPFI